MPSTAELIYVMENFTYCAVIKLLEHGIKVMERIFKKQLRKQVENDKMQIGFMPEKAE